MAASTLARVSAMTLGSPLTTRLTVIGETPAARATSATVGPPPPRREARTRAPLSARVWDASVIPPAYAANWRRAIGLARLHLVTLPEIQIRIMLGKGSRQPCFWAQPCI